MTLNRVCVCVCKNFFCRQFMVAGMEMSYYAFSFNRENWLKKQEEKSLVKHLNNWFMSFNAGAGMWMWNVVTKIKHLLFIIFSTQAQFRPNKNQSSSHALCEQQPKKCVKAEEGICMYSYYLPLSFAARSAQNVY